MDAGHAAVSGRAAGRRRAFLEETFSAATAPPEHRLHQKAARAVLKALLPESGTDIKGHMRLRERSCWPASGYAAGPRDFDDLLRILDGELRLSSPRPTQEASGGVRLASGEASSTRRQGERGRQPSFVNSVAGADAPLLP